MKTVAAATLLAASLIGLSAPAPAHADCGDPDQPPCTGPVPTVDQVVAIMAELTDPNRPAASKTDIVTPGFAPDEAGTIDGHLNEMNAREARLPLNFVVTDIQPAPANFAGATVATTGGYHQRNSPKPIVLVDQGGHWRITSDTAIAAVDNFYFVAFRPGPAVGAFK
jgi:hypothetical protein